MVVIVHHVASQFCSCGANYMSKWFQLDRAVARPTLSTTNENVGQIIQLTDLW